LIAGNFEGEPVRRGSFGKASPGFELAVVDNDGVRAKADAEGDLAVRLDRGFGADIIFKGYLSPDGKVTMREKKGPEGQRWYLTGDRAYEDKDGYFWFVGRSDDGECGTRPEGSWLVENSCGTRSQSSLRRPTGSDRLVRAPTLIPPHPL
jgi:acyl-CoA synthetase (AMP-forming)/AMP-acid ligase II